MLPLSGPHAEALLLLSPHAAAADRRIPVLGVGVDDVTVDLGPLAFLDAVAVHDALAFTIAAGYFTDPDEYASVIVVKSMLSYRIAKAEKTASWAEPA